MRICIFGAGAIGSFVTAKLAASGADVRLVARGPALDAIRAQGLRLETPAGAETVQVPVSDDPATFGPQDVVLVATKAHGLKAAAAAAQPLLGPETRVVFAQNGVPWWYAHGFAAPGLAQGPLAAIDPDGAIWRGFGPERAVGCTAFAPNSVPAPGVVRYGATYPAKFALGQPDGEVAPKTAAFAEALQAAGIEAPVSTDMRRDVWTKLLFNVATASTCVLTGSTIKRNMSDPGVRQIARALTAETVAIAASHGFDVAVDLDRQTDPQTRPDHKSSMLQDFEAGRRMEIDPIFAVPADFARAAGVATPVLDVVLPLLRQKALAAGLYEPAA